MIKIVQLTIVFLLISMLALATEDVTGPSLTAFSISPVTISTSTGIQSVVVTLTITDALSGVKHGSLYFNSPSRIQGISGQFNSANRTSGDANNGVYATTISFPQYSQVGDWTLNGASITDMCGNYLSIPAGSALFMGYNTVTTY